MTKFEKIIGIALVVLLLAAVGVYIYATFFYENKEIKDLLRQRADEATRANDLKERELELKEKAKAQPEKAVAPSNTAKEDNATE